ncbi:MAG: hypothetical protein QOI29_339, partial [Mycobacterium sp.]|nr:hypothetical protein [Mycobacterium sp.]
DVPACGASLRRVRGRDLLDPTTSLVVQTRGQKRPTASADSAVQPTLLRNPHAGLPYRSPRTAGHSLHITGLDADRVEAPRDVSGGLFHPIFASVGLPRFQFRDRQFRASSTAGAALGASQSLLQHRQPPGLTTTQARGVQQFTGRQCRRHRNTTVDTHHAAVTRTGDRSRDVGERDMPATGPITGDPVGLHTRWDRSRQAEANPTDLGHPHPTEPAIQTLDMMRFDRDLPEPLMHTGFTPRRAAVRSVEKVAHHLSEVPQRLLLHGLRTGRQPIVLGAGCGQLNTLLVIAGRAATGLPVQLLLDGQVPHIPGVATMLRQHHRLFSGRKQPVTRHKCNVTKATDTSPKGEAAISSPAKPSSFHAAMIE